MVQATLVVDLPQVKGGAREKSVKSRRIWVTRELQRHTVYLAHSRVLRWIHNTRRNGIIYTAPAHGAAGVCGEVGAVLHGGAPALGGEGAAHPEPARARPLRHARPL